ncbi:hypothetical protein BACPU_12210 [Bacillus pumilus]|nr:hypothetical protein BACPU_12210 [Bacillus pumilus]
MIKTVSQFIPHHMQVAADTQITILTKKEDFDKEMTWLNGKQGSVKVINVSFAAVIIQAERDGMMYELKQPIDPIVSVLPHDER